MELLNNVMGSMLALIICHCQLKQSGSNCSDREVKDQSDHNENIVLYLSSTD